jgi:hypothetical protein
MLRRQELRARRPREVADIIRREHDGKVPRPIPEPVVIAVRRTFNDGLSFVELIGPFGGAEPCSPLSFAVGGLCLVAIRPSKMIEFHI